MEEEDEDGSIESLLRWASHIGISDASTTTHHSLSLGSSLFVSHFPHSGGRGLAAVRDLRMGELILRVPKSALMTTHSVMQHTNLSQALNRHPSLSSTQVDEAIWVTEKAVLKTKSDWQQAHALMEDLKFKPRLLTFKAWVWASATISSRTLHIPWDSAGCLCPVGDLFNYDAPGKEPSDIGDLEDLLSSSSIHDGSLSNEDNTTVADAEQLDSQSQRLTDGGFEEDANAYCFYARANYNKGDQVLLCYGTYTNLELLEHYGFILQENPNDKVFIPLEPAVYSSTSWSRESLYIHYNGKPSFALLAALRLWATPQIKRRSVAHLVYSGSKISADNENFIMKWLLKTCHGVLKNLPTSIEDDTLLLNAMDNSQDFCTFLEVTKLMSLRDEVDTFLEAHNMKDKCSDSSIVLSRKTRWSMDKWKLSIQWRINYKKVLLDCISYCSQILDSLVE
ncbi:protein SET DOMAIN GROUP 40-like isoform X2 [Arachis ipaensis]|uniref:protein SET DOMAIN GROUP 40-like isoform X2 n=1 Tax=Arachis ipaensis TaxID=130454 RepID=UPI000A2B911B|nr:protein SET DOMAIN GROUP 40-like isoform X2 [Arachis ipaensis]